MKRAVHLYMPRGDAKVFPFEVDGDITGAVFKMHARYAEGDASPFFTLTSGASTIAVTDGPAGLGEIRIPPSATSALTRKTTLLWDLEITTGAGPETILSGYLHVYPDVTHD